MRPVINLLFFLGSFAFIAACKNESASSKKDPSVSTASSGTKKGFYKHLRGTVGTFPVTMDLVQSPTTINDEGLPRISGYYSYDKYQKPMPIYGMFDATGAVEIAESGQDGASGIFKGKFNADGSFSGTWTDESKKLTYNFMLRETMDDSAIGFEIFPYEDSTKLFANTPNSPQATFAMDALLPAKNTEGSLFEFLRTEIIKHLKGDSIAGNYTKWQLSDVQKAARDTFFTNYKADLKEEKPDSTETAMLNHTQSTSMEVVSNTDGLLTLAFRDYAYTGGAHGNHGTYLMTFDIKNKKVVTLKDLFKPNYQSVLNAAIMRSARSFFGVKPKESLEGSALVTTVEANDNFMVNRKGIVFNYVPYEIASYAQGEIQLFVPFDELKTILK